MNGDRRPRREGFRHPAQLVVVGFVVASLVGGGLLALPIASEEPDGTGLLTAMFTATSAVCVTGLVVVDTAAHWSRFGEVVILLLIQIGGFGIMAASSLLALLLAHRLGLRQRLLLSAERATVGLGDVRRVLRGVALFSLAFEATAALVLFLRFWLSHGESAGRAAYVAVFHAVSAFNNAGFALFSDNMIGFDHDPVLLLTITVTVVLGGLGFPVLLELLRASTRPARWSLHTKITLAATGGLLAAGWVLIALVEWTNPDTLGAMNGLDKAVNGLFHSVMPRTAGFNSLDMASMRDPSQLLTEVLMAIGGGSGSTAGGMKVTTFALLGFVMWAEVRGQPDVVAFRRRVPEPLQRQAVSVALLFIGMIVAATMLLSATTDLRQIDVRFEAISALGTVGLSTGITGVLSDSSQLVIIGLMLIGRVGPVTVFTALVLRERALLYRHPEERLIIG